MSNTCDHNYQFQGVVYHDGYRLPGTGACERVYEDAYYCSRCLDTQYKNRRVFGNNYSKPLQGAMPK